MKRAVLYLRVSTPGQVQTDYDPEGLSIPAQRSACERKARELGFVVVDEYVEPGRTGTRIDKRPVFQRLLARLEADRDIDCILVYSLSRFARNRLESASVLLGLRKLHVTLVSATENIDASPVGQLVHGMLDAVNEFRSASEGADIKYKMSQKVIVNGGTISRAPIGYRNAPEVFEGREIRVVVVDPERAPLVRYAYELYATGDYSVTALTEILNARGLRYPATAKCPERPVSRQMVFKMLRNRYYLGEVSYEGIWYPGRHEAIINEALFRRVQDVFTTHGAGERQRVHHHYLRGLFRCARCGYRMIYTQVVNAQDETYEYYFCRGYQDKACSRVYLPAAALEEAVLGHYASLAFQPAVVARIEDDLHEALKHRLSRSDVVRAQLEKQLAQLREREDKFLDLAGDGEIPRDGLRRKLRELGVERERYQRDLEGLDTEWEVGAETIRLALELLEDSQAAYRQATDPLRRRLNHVLFDHVLVEDASGVQAKMAEPFQSLSSYAQSLNDDIKNTTLRGGVLVGVGATSRRTTRSRRAPSVAGSSNKTSMVELLAACSNAPSATHILSNLKDLLAAVKSSK